MNKFNDLSDFLKSSSEKRIKISFNRLNELLRGELADSAYKHRAYFANTPTHSIAKVWLDAGYIVNEVNLLDKYVVFVKKVRNEKIVVSPSLLSKYFNENFIPDFKLVVSPITYGWVKRRYCIDDKNLINYINRIGGKFETEENEFKTFADFIDASDFAMHKVEEMINLIYKSSILSFVYSINNQKLTNIDQINNLDFQFAYMDNEFNNLMIKRYIQSICILENVKYEEFINKISKINNSEIKDCFLLDTPYLHLKFQAYCKSELLNNIKIGELTYNIEKVLELFNIEFSKDKGLMYKTDQEFCAEILSGSYLLKILS